MSGEVRAVALEALRIDTHLHYPGEILDLRKAAKTFGPFTEKPNMSESRANAIGCAMLYGIEPGLFLRPDAPEALFEKADELRAHGPAKALERAWDTAHITTQLAFTDHRPERSGFETLSPRMRLLAYIDEAIAGNALAFCPDGADPEFKYYDALCGHWGELAGLEEYLEALDGCIDSWRKHNVVGMKTAFAYTVGLDFSDPSRAEARAAFGRKRDMTAAEVATVQHYAFRHALLACIRNELPAVIHTGFQIWGYADLRQSNPMHLHKLLIDKRYKDLAFVLLHGGNPYVGETTYLARMFPNVIIDFTWIAWMTRGRFRAALAEWLEIVRHGKFCWGSDSNTPEDIVGKGQITREEIANVLEDLIARRIIDEPTAIDFLDHAYQKTPKRVFGL